MSTPKDKLVQNQSLSTKKKRFYKILKSANYDDDYCATADDEIQDEFNVKIRSIIEETKKTFTNKSSSKLDDESLPTVTTNKSNTTIKSKKHKFFKTDKKVFKNSDLVFGLSQILKLIKNGQLSLVFLEKSIAHNLASVVRKLCAVNKVYCLNFDLTSLRIALNLSALSVMAFRRTVEDEKSLFFPIYKSLANSIFVTISSKAEQETAREESKNDIKPNEELLANENNQAIFNKDFLFYQSQSEDTYCEIIRKRMKVDDEKSQENEFQKQCSFISITPQNERSKIHFPSYNNLKNGMKNKLKILLELPTCDSNNNGTASDISNRLTHQLFNLDQFGPCTSGIGKKMKFVSPKLVRGQINTIPSNSGKKGKEIQTNVI